MKYSDQILEELTFHSTAIEGATLTKKETTALLREGIVPAGKPMNQWQMVVDHFQALQFILKMAEEKRPVTIELVQTITAKILQNTGTVYHTALGNIDSSKGEFRKGNVSSGESYFMSYNKVEGQTRKLAALIREKMKTEMAMKEVMELSFIAHLKLVSIHPFYDGNGRASRLLMNYIQAYFNLPLVIVPVNDRDKYISALVETRKSEKQEIFLTFMENCPVGNPITM